MRGALLGQRIPHICSKMNCIARCTPIAPVCSSVKAAEAVIGTPGDLWRILKPLALPPRVMKGFHGLA